MSFLRRVFGGGASRAVGDSAAAGPAGPALDDVDDDARDRALRAEDARRLSNELLARQLRYADRSWTPPAQGGPRRADDTESDEGR